MSKTEITVAGKSDMYTNICPDGHACDNDSSCVESLLQERKYVCDCNDAYLQSGRVFAGLSCQHVATEYCTETGEISQAAFCVNQGVCKAKVAPKASHPGCDCPKFYTGEHCEFIEGSVPIETSYFFDGTTYMAKYRNTEGSGVHPAAMVVPILFVAFGFVAYFLWKYRGFSFTNSGHVVDKTKTADENALEADGTSLSLSMQKVLAGRRNSTPMFSSSHKAALMDPPDFEDLLEQSDHVAFHMDPTHSAAHKLFASDPMLHYTPTTLTTGSGSPSNNGKDEYDLSQNQVFEEYDPNDFASDNDVDGATFPAGDLKLI